MTPASLQRLIARLHFTHAQLAQELGVSRNTVTRWVMGLHPIPPMAVKLLTQLSTDRRRATR
jgi:plasmid maintenance system antidote protein VapI